MKTVHVYDDAWLYGLTDNPTTGTAVVVPDEQATRWEAVLAAYEQVQDEMGERLSEIRKLKGKASLAK